MSASPTGVENSAGKSDRRTRARERRRADLYRAAMDLFVERTFEGTTMEDIAERADVARGTVFNHFPKKTDFLLEWATRRRARALQAAYSASADESASLRAVLVRYFTQMGSMATEGRSEAVAVILSPMHSTDIWRHSPLATEFTEVIDRARAAGEVAGDVDAARIGMLLSSSYYAILTAWAGEEPAPFDLTIELIGTIDLLLNGILERP